MRIIISMSVLILLPTLACTSTVAPSEDAAVPDCAPRDGSCPEGCAMGVEAHLIDHDAMCLRPEPVDLSCPMLVGGAWTCYRDSEGREYGSGMYDAALWEEGWEMCVLPDFANDLQFCD